MGRETRCNRQTISPNCCRKHNDPQEIQKATVRATHAIPNTKASRAFFSPIHAIEIQARRIIAAHEFAVLTKSLPAHRTVV
jgi:hypothetical protein